MAVAFAPNGVEPALHETRANDAVGSSGCRWRKASVRPCCNRQRMGDTTANGRGRAATAPGSRLSRVNVSLRSHIDDRRGSTASAGRAVCELVLGESAEQWSRPLPVEVEISSVRWPRPGLSSSTARRCGGHCTSACGSDSSRPTPASWLECPRRGPAVGSGVWRGGRSRRPPAGRGYDVQRSAHLVRMWVSLRREPRLESQRRVITRETERRTATTKRSHG